MTVMLSKEIIGIIGGTGPEGQGLALRLGLAGFPIIIGSRNPEKGTAAIEKLLSIAPDLSLSCKDNLSTAEQSDIVVISVPFEAHQPTLEAIKSHLVGKIVINVVVPLTFNKGTAYPVVLPEGSAAVQSQNLLPESKVISAFHNVAAPHLLTLSHSVDCDVIICGDDEQAKRKVCSLAEHIQGVKSIDGGPLSNAQFSEQLTALLINLNKIYKSHTMIRFTGLPA
ncbi:MAG: NADPH-dependent F420 reductase [Dehalococcoidia bacterium]|nr:NADPH-dependent F420 reductase [Dehalococcoidia bacterium]